MTRTTIATAASANHSESPTWEVRPTPAVSYLPNTASIQEVINALNLVRRVVIKGAVRPEALDLIE